MFFADCLLKWFYKNGRDLPWRGTHDPYIIWLSEIILQQTRVEQGMPYFQSFVTQFPTVADFASASEEEILRLWQGLGYYSRARNMHKAAKAVMQDFGGIFPSSYTDVLSLTGVGEYTAAAISSFAADERRAVLDGNVFRVLARHFGIDTPINSTTGKKQFKELADALISPDHPGLYNHAIMDFGATVCKPKAPLCETCTFRLSCQARQEDTVSTLPVKLKAKASRNRYFHYFIIEQGDTILMSQRGEGDVWANLFEFPLIESETDLSIPELVKSTAFIKHFEGAVVAPLGPVVKHVLSHQNIYARFYRLSNLSDVSEKKVSWKYHLSENLDNLAKHKLIFSFINKYL